MALPYYIDKMDNGQSISSQCDSCDCDCIFSKKRSKDRVDMAFGALFYPGLFFIYFWDKICINEKCSA